MIAKLTLVDGTEAVLGDDMRWSHEDALIRIDLNAMFTDSQPGDHHQPDGCAMANRAADYLQADLVYGVPPYPDDGDVMPPGMTTNKGGDNCGIASGGFTKGNKCATGGKSTKKVPEGKGKTNSPTSKPLSSPGAALASPAERKAAAAIAKSKIKAAPVPPKEKVKAYRAKLKAARKEGLKARKEGRTFSQREFLDARGSSKDRKRRAQMLFKEFGGEEKGYVVCHVTGLKMHWTDDKTLNPKGYEKFEQGKIFTAVQGGGYQPHNLLPESFVANRSRNDATVRSENL